jgi:hypothetical protein
MPDYVVENETKDQEYWYVNQSFRDVTDQQVNDVRCGSNQQLCSNA